MLIIYSKNGCSACINAKNLLKSCDIEFIEKNVDEDFGAFDFIISEQHRSFPQIYMNGKLFVKGGYQGLLAMGTDEIKLAVYGQEKLAS